jgi:hypothetical protein
VVGSTRDYGPDRIDTINSEPIASIVAEDTIAPGTRDEYTVSIGHDIPLEKCRILPLLVVDFTNKRYIREDGNVSLRFPVTLTKMERNSIFLFPCPSPAHLVNHSLMMNLHQSFDGSVRPATTRSCSIVVHHTTSH